MGIVVVVVAGSVVEVVAVGAVVVVGDATVVEVVAGGAVVVVGAATEHVGAVMMLSSRVTAPFRASTRPSTVAPLLSVADVNAIMEPTKLVVVPNVAELPTCQKTLHACAPFSRTTLLLDAVVRLDPAWKMNTAFGSPPPFNVTEPVKAKADEDW